MRRHSNHVAMYLSHEVKNALPLRLATPKIKCEVVKAIVLCKLIKLLPCLIIAVKIKLRINKQDVQLRCEQLLPLL